MDKKIDDFEINNANFVDGQAVKMKSVKGLPSEGQSLGVQSDMGQSVEMKSIEGQFADVLEEDRFLAVCQGCSDEKILAKRMKDCTDKSESIAEGAKEREDESENAIERLMDYTSKGEGIERSKECNGNCNVCRACLGDENCEKKRNLTEEKFLFERLEEYDDCAVVPFHMPGHKRKAYEFLRGAHKIDVTEIEGFDNLHNANGVIMDTETVAGEVFGSPYTRILVNGSTGGILAGIRTLCAVGDEILIARNCHKSVFNAVELAYLKPTYLVPTYLEEGGFYGAVLANDVKNALEKNKNIKCVVITSPTYEGVISDVKSIAKVCHDFGATLFVDEAHGAHLSLDCHFEKSARELGADLVVNSLHKTLPCLTQSAVLHAMSERVDKDRLNKNLAIFQTSSPSYVLMSAIDGCVRFVRSGAKGEFEAWHKNLVRTKNALSRLEHLKLFAPQKSEKAFAYDISKIVILCGEADISGVQLKKLLREKYNIELEMASESYAIAMSGLGDEDKNFDALIDALCEIDKRLTSKHKANVELPKIAQKVFEPYQIDTLSVEYVKFENIVGRVIAENIWAYPPGAPLIVKGEVVSEDTVENIKELIDAGVEISSETNKMPSEVLCVK